MWNDFLRQDSGPGAWDNPNPVGFNDSPMGGGLAPPEPGPPGMADPVGSPVSDPMGGPMAGPMGHDLGLSTPSPDPMSNPMGSLASGPGMGSGYGPGPGFGTGPDTSVEMSSPSMVETVMPDRVSVGPDKGWETSYTCDARELDPQFNVELSQPAPRIREIDYRLPEGAPEGVILERPGEDTGWLPGWNDPEPAGRKEPKDNGKEPAKPVKADYGPPPKPSKPWKEPKVKIGGGLRPPDYTKQYARQIGRGVGGPRSGNYHIKDHVSDWYRKQSFGRTSPRIGGSGSFRRNPIRTYDDRPARFRSLTRTMSHCPKCKARLVKGRYSVTCPKCGWSFNIGDLNNYAEQEEGGE